MPRPIHLVALTLLALVIICAAHLAPPAAARHVAFGHGPTVVLLHGLGSSAEDWLPTARRLASRHRVELVDLPGHGGTEMPEPFSLERAAAALDASLAQISDEPVILVGHSLGGLLAAAEAIEHPARVRGLVLVETALKPQIPEDQRAAALDRLEHDYRAVLHEAYMDFGRDAAQGEKLYRNVAALDPRMVSRWIRIAWTADLSPEAPRLTVPVLVVLAERSWPSGQAWGAAAETLGYEGAPRLRALRIEGCGHFIMLDRPDRLAAVIAGFSADPEGLRMTMR
ncbi:MAG: alpha/beta fold hydrolase [Candidatus Eisenbacteria bacterium]|uniref:Alpha/beta fold hydrolase n=1 Tax=Eiseniibacteriota bacterium TaxID=2212470 RepID=A0A9D6QPU3_UNCEI|nr:alpha/beta fold hydrolase [Candidatus Eisenbacteria bacterium]MBI3540264.1 alpha/beta fold hydrolase [Candidatus Eisenbacteria bacterium]